MNRLGKALVLCSLCFFIVLPPALLVGCGDNASDIIKKHHEEIVLGIQIGVMKAAEYGFKKWNDADPAACKEAATKLAKNISEQIKPWIQGDGKLKSSQEIQEFVNSSLFKNLPQEALDAIVAAAAVLDVYLPTPDVNEKLTEQQIDYIMAFLTGLEKAANIYTGDTRAALGKPNIWIKPST